MEVSHNSLGVMRTFDFCYVIQVSEQVENCDIHFISKV